MLLFKLLIVPIAFYCCASNIWKGIIPLKTTREEVEQILGKRVNPDSNGYDIADYKFKGGTAYIVFTLGGCRGGVGDYNVPAGRVNRVSFQPDPQPAFRGFKFDRKRFVEGGHPDGPSPSFFVNRLDGISFWLSPDEQSVQRINYFPSSKEDHLKCKDTKR